MKFDIRAANANDEHGLLARANLVFDEDDGMLAGMKLGGFTVRRRDDGMLEAGLPANVYSVNGERRQFELVRDAADRSQNESIRVNRLRKSLIDAWLEQERARADR